MRHTLLRFLFITGFCVMIFSSVQNLQAEVLQSTQLAVKLKGSNGKNLKNVPITLTLYSAKATPRIRLRSNSGDRGEVSLSIEGLPVHLTHRLMLASNVDGARSRPLLLNSGHNQKKIRLEIIRKSKTKLIVTQIKNTDFEEVISAPNLTRTPVVLPPEEERNEISNGDLEDDLSSSQIQKIETSAIHTPQISTAALSLSDPSISICSSDRLLPNGECIDPFTAVSVFRVTGSAGDLFKISRDAGLVRTWSRVAKPRYVIDSAFNATSRNVVLLNGTQPIIFELNATSSSLSPTHVPRLPADILPPGRTASFLWSTLSGEENTIYFFPPPVRESISQPFKQSRRIIKYDTMTKTSTELSPFSTSPSFQFNVLGGKMTFATFNNNLYTVILGTNDYSNRFFSTSWLYIVNLTTGKPVSKPFLVTGSDCGTRDSESCREFYTDSVRFSPDGRNLLLYYAHARDPMGRSWRVLDVDLSQAKNDLSNVITTHRASSPPVNCINCASGDPAKGHLPVYLVHPTFAISKDRQVYIVGGSLNWFGKTYKEVSKVGLSPVIGKIVGYNLRTNQWKSLTDPMENGKLAEGTISHIAASNTSVPGKIYVSYLSDSTNRAKYGGAILEVSIDNPLANSFITHHHTDESCGLSCQAHLNISPDGKHLLFPSNWGDSSPNSFEVATYLVNVPQ